MASTPTPFPRARRGLIVEDQTDTRAWLVRMLGVAFDGIAISEAATFQAARDWIAAQPRTTGEPDPGAIRDIALIVSRDLGAPVTFAEGAGPDARNYRVDFTKITQQLPEFRPEWTIPLGVAELARDMRTYGLTAEEFDGPRFTRLAQIRKLLEIGRIDDELRLTSPQLAGVAKGGAS